LTSGFECLMRHGGDGGDGAGQRASKRRERKGRGTKATDAAAVLLRRRLAISDRVSFRICASRTVTETWALLLKWPGVG
jgi:hypothetical protein